MLAKADNEQIMRGGPRDLTITKSPQHPPP